MKWIALISLLIKKIEIGYCGYPAFPYVHIELYQATKLILANFLEEDHPFINDTQKNKELGSLYFFLQT